MPILEKDPAARSGVNLVGASVPCAHLTALRQFNDPNSRRMRSDHGVEGKLEMPLGLRQASVNGICHQRADCPAFRVCETSG